MFDKELLNGATVVIWCGFCSSCEADAGTLSFDFDGQPLELSICTDCLTKARAAGKIDEDN